MCGIRVLLYFFFFCLCVSEKPGNFYGTFGEVPQLEYADRAGMLGNPLIACVSEVDQSIVLCTQPIPLQSLMDRRSIEKVSKVDSNIWIAFSGLAGDGRSLIRHARKFCSVFRFEYGCAPPVFAVARELGDVEHKCTLGTAERPYGVHCLVLGFDDVAESDNSNEVSFSPKIFLTKPSGQVTRWRGVSIGRNCLKNQEKLEEEIKKHLSLEGRRHDDGEKGADRSFLSRGQLSETLLASISIDILKKDLEKSGRGGAAVVGAKDGEEQNIEKEMTFDVYTLKRSDRLIDGGQQTIHPSPVLKHFAGVTRDILVELFRSGDVKL